MNKIAVMLNILIIEINIKNIPNKFIRFKIYEIFKLNKCNIKYYNQKFLISNESDLKNLFKKL